MAVKGSLAPRMLALGFMQRYDFTGLDLSAQNFKNDKFVDAPVDLAPRTLLAHVEKGELGVKTGKGFYDYGSMTMDEASQKRDELLWRSEEHTSELQSIMRISYAVFCLKKKNENTTTLTYET